MQRRSNITLGANLTSNSTTEFAVWAPRAKVVRVEIVDRADSEEKIIKTADLKIDSDGVARSLVHDCPAGTLYRIKIDQKPGRPDPRSRFQPFGVHGPSMVCDTNGFQWSDQAWNGVEKKDLVIYETHIGSMSKDGTYQSALEDLPRLKELGITAIELLPVSQTPGKWNWGYDGVNYFAPRNTFGTPDDLKHFINACHVQGFAVFLDVVYNHVGPEGNYLNEIGPYRSKKFGTPWGDSLDFDETQVRDFVLDNIEYWIKEFHFDGLRLDAVHYMFDDSKLDIVDEVQHCFKHIEETEDRKIYLIGESNIYDSHLVGNVDAPAKNWNAIWSDCLMHSLYSVGRPDLRLTNREYAGEADLAAAIENAYVFAAPEAIRVTDHIRAKHHPTGDRTYVESLIMALQTHDSVGNHPHGKRIHQLMNLEFQLAAAPLFLLYPSIPMIFMGEEIATDSPFPFFADFEDEGLRKAVDKGRRDEYPHHDWKGSPLPSDPLAFTASIPKAAEHSQRVFEWYRSLLAFRKQGLAEGWLDSKRKTTKVDLTHDLYQMIFEKDGKKIVVCTRLRSVISKVAAKPMTHEELEVGKVLFDSRGSSESLLAQHAVIWES